jgi:hypothetical protein
MLSGKLPTQCCSLARGHEVVLGPAGQRQGHCEEVGLVVLYCQDLSATRGEAMEIAQSFSLGETDRLVITSCEACPVSRRAPA